MIAALRKRLERVENQVTGGCAVVMQLGGESGSEMDDRVARWQAGESVEGMDTQYSGQSPIIRVRFMGAQKREPQH